MSAYKNLIFLTLLVLLAYFLQIQEIVTDDVINGMYLAKMTLAGGNFVNDFYEINPPLVLYLYMIPVIFSKLTGISTIISVKLYVTLLAFSSLICSFFLTKKPIILYTALFILLFLPAYEFGQREHLMMILTLPYFLSTILRLEKKVISPGLASLIGIAGGIGFAIKPFFLPAFILTELYIMLSTRHLFSWIRIESIIICTLLPLYFAWTILFFPEYTNIIMPLALEFYFASTAQPLSIILQNPKVIFLIATIIFYILTRKIDHFKNTSNIFFLALLGFIVSFMIPRTPWDYHILPALGMACLLCTFLFGQLVLNISIEKFSKTLILMGAAIALLLPPIKFTTDSILASINTKNNLTTNPLIAYFKNEKPGTTFNCLSLSLRYEFLAGYSNMNFSGIFANLWWETGYQVLIKNNINNIRLKKDRAFLINALANDIENNKPTFIIVDTSQPGYIHGVNFNLLHELLGNNAFSLAWKNYHYKTTVDLYQIFERTE